MKVHIRNPHDRGYDIYTGRDVSAGEHVGSIYWDAQGLNSGFVLTLRGEHDLFPDSADEVVELLRDHGYELYPASSAEDIASLRPADA